MAAGWMQVVCRALTRLAGAVLLATAASSAYAQAVSGIDRQAVGTWYGEFSRGPGRVVQRFLTTRNPDGSFTLQARLYDSGKMVSELRNRGLWGVSNGIYFTVTTEVDGQRVDPRKPEVINAYLVLRLEGDEFEYIHVASDNRFKVRKVDPANAQLPN